MLFLIEAVGFGMPTAEDVASYGIYTASAYILALPGGWIADRFWGCRRAILGGFLVPATWFQGTGTM